MRRLLALLQEYRVLLLVLALVGAQIATWIAVRSIDQRLDAVHDTILINSCGTNRACRVVIVQP